MLAGSDNRNGTTSEVCLWQWETPAGWAVTARLRMVSPSYLAVHPWLRIVYVVSEVERGTVCAIDFSTPGRLKLLSTLPTHGASPCHVTVNSAGTRAAVSNYDGGNVSVFELDERGDLGRRLWTTKFSGCGPDRIRQRSAHPHQATFVGENLLVTDLGSDAVHLLSPEGGVIRSYAAPAGFGPRHLVVRDDESLVVLGELRAEVAVLEPGPQEEHWRTRVPSSRQSMKALPSGIVSDGRYVFVANRVTNSIMKVEFHESATDDIRWEESSCGGDGPRDLELLGSRLCVANQDSSLIVFLDKDSLQQRECVEQPSVSCVVAVPQ
ncbi:lactonase family protein [Salinibacterium sp.]|uniref:lactonase family protein n=1 Tax=Salinibacterium sp. TaxID=1915057 RepID=UPI0037C74EDB